ncbi:hypothetical protein BT93_L5729 [Corymbia citriodora subsp. variegata]|uniref:PGG domain-containing protein n=1 Tax=Corymbia citriodora subsp. variegata TaxID=360336 RepID=A0A8T0CRP0_CORYI|nr:hypothetical protein BT93_L5729 [Corymbia citriodora subsp. variegata]
MEVHEDEGGVSLNNASVYAAARKLADVIKGANVEDINSMINELTCQTNSSAIFNFRELSEGSLLHIAAATGKIDILRLLLEHVDANLVAAKDDCWNTPLHIAAKAKAHVVADLLIHQARNLSSGEDNNWILRRKNKHGNTALHEAVLTRDARLVSHLLSIELEPVYWENVDRKSPLYLALDTGNSEIFWILLSYSFDPSRIEGLPPVHGVVAREQYDLLDEILKKNVKLFTMTDSKGGNIFHLAAFWNVPQVFKHLQLETEYLAREPDSNGDLPIHIASKRGHVAVIKKLLVVSPWVNSQGQTILHVAAKYGREKAVRYILRHPDLREMINERDHDGNTPSHLAVKYLQPAALMHLVLDERMNPSLLNREHLAIVDYAPDPPRRGSKRFPLNEDSRGMVNILLQSLSAKRSDLITLKPEARDKKYANISLVNPRELRENINTLMLVATLVTTVTFAARFTVLGGLNSSDMASKDDRGMAMMLDNKMFHDFVFCNTIAMFCSMTSVVFFMLAYLTEVHLSMLLSLVAGMLLAMSLPAMSLAFFIGVTLTVGKLPWLAKEISFVGHIFIIIIIITGALVPPMVLNLVVHPFVIRCLRPIRPLVSWFILACLCFLRVETTIDDSKEDQTGSKTSASPPLDGGGED